MIDLVDIHCHMLPGVDDGAESIEETRQLFAQAQKSDITRLVFTPHFYPERISVEEFLYQREKAVERIEALARENRIQYRVGAEVQITPVLADLPLEKLAFSGTQYLLLELLPLYQPLDVTGVIRRIRAAGYTPILAHIERFHYIETNPGILCEWIQAGALAQINVGWVLKDSKALRRVKKYFKCNLIHILASDVHSIDVRPQKLVEGYNLLPDTIAHRFKDNALKIFNNEEIEKEEPILPHRFGRLW